MEGFIQKVKESKKSEGRKKTILKYSFTCTRRVVNVSTKGGEANSTLLYVSVSSTRTADFPFQNTSFRNADIEILNKLVVSS